MEKEYDKTTLAGILFLYVLLIAADLAGYILPFSADRYLDNAIPILRLICIVVLLSHGTFYNSKYFKKLYFSFSVICIGAMFKIMHWPYGPIILITGILSIVIIYFLFFIQKRNKTALDYLKVIFIVGYYSGVVLKIFHLPGSAPIFILETLIFDILFLLFIFEYYRKLHTDIVT